MEDLLVVPQEFAGDSPNPRDCVLLLKQWVCSTELAQAPILILPAARLSRLARHLTPVPRNALSKDAMKEYKGRAEPLPLAAFVDLALTPAIMSPSSSIILILNMVHWRGGSE